MLDRVEVLERCQEKRRLLAPGGELPLTDSCVSLLRGSWFEVVGLSWLVPLPFGTDFGAVGWAAGAGTSSCCGCGCGCGCCCTGVIDTCVLLRLNMLDIVRLKLGALLLVDLRDRGGDWGSCSTALGLGFGTSIGLVAVGSGVDACEERKGDLRGFTAAFEEELSMWCCPWCEEW